MTDISNYTIREKIRADVVDETPNTYLARLPDGNVVSVSKTSTDGLLCGVDAIDPYREISGTGRALLDDEYIEEYGATGLEVTVEIDLTDGSGTISVDDTNDVPLTGANLAQVIQMIVDILEDDEEADQGAINFTRRQSDLLFQLYEEILESRVREDIVRGLSSEYHSVTDITDEGWIIQDTYLVTYDGAENYLVDNPTVYEVDGNGVTRTNDVRQAIGISFDAPPMAVVEIRGEEVTLSRAEIEFLATIEIELAWREEELRNAARDVFYDTSNNDNARWEKIQSTEDSAPCPPHVYKTLKAKYGPRGN